MAREHIHRVERAERTARGVLFLATVRVKPELPRQRLPDPTAFSMN